jgi:23S rRNA G2445 N2-methylase RlmL
VFCGIDTSGVRYTNGGYKTATNIAINEVLAAGMLLLSEGEIV